ncbi:MAG: alpha-amylase/4-alpha-glucanotransferase domain-containing protein [Candidatus Limnocylindrales bacterium]
MTERRIALTLVLHNHQPVGNFGFVFEENYQKAYAPMLAALERHRGVRLGLHYTGPLLDWFKAERPEFIQRLRALVERDQVEVLGGGYYEPVLASLREDDRVGQLTRMADEVEALFGQRPAGAWLAERVWEPDVPTALVKSGYGYTIVDDAHFRAAAIPPELHWGPYSTDDQGYRLLVFGSEQGLRYRIPFRPVEEVIEYLREHATEDGALVGMMGDDGEKFGTWPGTWELCHGEGQWVEQFFSALEENSDWLEVLCPTEALAKHPPIGRVYLPTGSYAEMGEWSLPVEARREFTTLLHDAIEQEQPEARWMRGGFWRMFQVNYREINDLHKQMLRTSRKVEAIEAGKVGAQALAMIHDHLYQGQSNDCYWHGLFGGIYLSHMRLATLEHLIAAEDAAERAGGLSGVQIQTADFDVDGYDELLVSTAGQVVTLKPNEGGGIGSWDIRAARHALASVMRRRPEAYHDTLRAADAGELPEQEAGEGAVSIHDLVKVNEPGISSRLWYDDYERRSGLVHLLPPETTAETFEQASFDELGDFVSGPFEVAGTGDGMVELVRDGSIRHVDGTSSSLRVRKTHRFGDDRRTPTLDLHVQLTNTGDRTIEALLGIEFDLNLLGGGGNPRAWYKVNGETGGFDARRTVSSADHVGMGNDHIGVELESRPTPGAAAWWSSIETMSLSESGFEGNHQGGCLLWVWQIGLAPDETTTVSLANLVRTHVDRAEDEGL